MPTLKIIAEFKDNNGVVKSSQVLNTIKWNEIPKGPHSPSWYETWSGALSTTTITASTNGIFNLKAQYIFTVKGRKGDDTTMPRVYINGSFPKSSSLTIHGIYDNKLMSIGTNGIKITWGKNNIASFMPSTDGTNAFDILLQVNNVWYPNDDSKFYGIKLTYGGIRMNFGDGNGWKTIEPDSNGFLKAN